MMIKLTKQVNSLESILERLEIKIDELTEKQSEIEYNAMDHDRDMTEKECDRYDALQEKIEELEAERDDIENALDYLREYTED